MLEFSVIQKVAVWVLPVLFAITVHEVSHGWVARWFGDPTAMMLGRLTLNPIKHIDPMGTIVIPLAMILLAGIGFGWAKPVPVTQENLRHPKRDMAVVAAAGPAANLAMAALWTVVLKIGLVLWSGGWIGPLGLFLLGAGVAGIVINFVLMLVNLIPIPPLDGGRVLAGFLPDRAAWKYGQVEPYGLIIVVVLLFTGALGWVVLPPLAWLTSLFTEIAGMDGALFNQVFYAITSPM